MLESRTRHQYEAVESGVLADTVDMWIGFSIGIAFIVVGIAWIAFLGKLSIRRYHGTRRLYRGLGGLLVGDAVWPPKYDSLAVVVQSALMLGLGVAILFGGP